MNDTVDIFIVDSDAPFTCPHDGARTDAIRNNGIVYEERCLHCGNVFYFEFVDEDEE